MSESWWDYVQRITGRAQQNEIADATGVEQSSISRWKLGKTRPKADAVVAVARAYNRAPVEALVAAGYLKEDEVSGVIEITASLDDLPEQDLLDAIRRRFRGPQANSQAPML